MISLNLWSCIAAGTTSKVVVLKKKKKNSDQSECNGAQLCHMFKSNK